MTRTNWPDLLVEVINHQHLTAEETAWAMDQIMSGEATSAQLAAFVVALRTKGETPDEVKGMLTAMLDHATLVPIDGPALDVVGTGGDRAHTVNISTMSALVAAAAGARVVKHGNRAASSKCGSADVLEQLGASLEQSADRVAAAIDDVGFGFCFAPMFHPAMRHAGPTRKELGIATVFNILGPLANPAQPSATFAGCAHEPLALVMAQVFADRGTEALVVKGRDGLDEASIFADTDVWQANAGRVTTGAISFAETGLQPALPDSLDGGDAAFNAQVVRELFAGEQSGNYQGIRNAVALNAAGSLVAWDAANSGEPADVGTITERTTNALPRAYEAIDSGAATKLLDRWIEFTNA